MIFCYKAINSPNHSYMRNEKQRENSKLEIEMKWKKSPVFGQPQLHKYQLRKIREGK